MSRKNGPKRMKRPPKPNRRGFPAETFQQIFGLSRVRVVQTPGRSRMIIEVHPFN